MESVGGYELVSVIGVGLSGTVWRARSPGPVVRTVALKRAVPPRRGDDRDSRERLRAEATLLAELDHPHIVEVLDVLDGGDGVAIVMPLARGGSLRALLDQRRMLSAGQVVALLAPVADALASAHRRALVHGDVKPANILLTEDGEPLLADFGAARHLGRAEAPDALVAGTAPYVDPDVLAGASPDARNDIYALGVVCFESLTGSLPVDGRVGQGLALAGARSVPGPLADLVERAISRRVTDRPVDMGQLAAELRASVDPTSIQLPGTPSVGTRPIDPATDGMRRDETRLFGPRPPVPAPVAGPPRRRRLVISLGVLSLLAVVVACALWLQRERDDDEPTATRAATVRAATTADPCATYPKLVAPAGTERFDIDLTGDGCRVPVTWDGQVLTARFAPQERTPRYYEIGRAGDELVFGDWDCDGAETPALYRPGTGEVIYVNSFGAHVGDRSRAEQIDHLAPRGTPRVASAPHGCQTVAIDP